MFNLYGAVADECDGENSPDALSGSARLKDLSAGLLSGLLTHADLLDPRCTLIVLTADDDLLAGELRQVLTNNTLLTLL